MKAQYTIKADVTGGKEINRVVTVTTLWGIIRAYLKAKKAKAFRFCIFLNEK